MMHDNGYISSGDWVGMALLMTVWTVAVVVVTAWTVSARRARARHELPEQLDRS